jgi:hypothetical protein
MMVGGFGCCWYFTGGSGFAVPLITLRQKGGSRSGQRRGPSCARLGRASRPSPHFTRPHTLPLPTLTLHVTGEHLVGVDGDEDTLAAREDFVFFVEDFGDVDVLAAFYAKFAGFDVQRLL